MEDTSGAPNICTNCGTQLHVGAVFCSSCGTRLSGLDAGVSVLGPDHGGGPVFVQFLGTGVQALGYGLLAGILMILIIPYGWGVSILAGWYVKNLAFSDGRTANFTGRGSQIWGYFILMIVLGILLSLIPIIGNIIAWLLSLRIQLAITRWFFSHIHLSAGKNLRFEGSYWPFFGWNFLWTVSFITIIGWAWVLRQGCAGSAEMLTWGRNTWSSFGAVWIYSRAGGQYLHNYDSLAGCMVHTMDYQQHCALSRSSTRVMDGSRPVFFRPWCIRYP